MASPMRLYAVGGGYRKVSLRISAHIGGMSVQRVAINRQMIDMDTRTIYHHTALTAERKWREMNEHIFGELIC